MPRAFRVALAVSWLILATPGSAAAAGFEDGLTYYLSGQYTQAFNAWRPLAEAGEIEAQFGLGLLYEQGQGVGRDLAAAAAWYARSAEQGSMRAQTQLGGMYARGDGVAEDWDQAIAWWLRAASQGSMRASFHLGQAYQFGSGVDRDYEQALQWYDLSAALGFSAATHQIQDINRHRKEAEESSALAAADPAAVSSEAGSVILETAGALKTQAAAPLIALGANSTRPLDQAHRIYLASYRSFRKANEGWQGLASAHTALLGELEAAVAQIDLGREKGVVYRLQAGPLPDISDANALCYKLSQHDIPCLVVSP